MVITIAVHLQTDCLSIPSSLSESDDVFIGDDRDMRPRTVNKLVNSPISTLFDSAARVQYTYIYSMQYINVHAQMPYNTDTEQVMGTKVSQ